MLSEKASLDHYAQVPASATKEESFREKMIAASLIEGEDVLGIIAEALQSNDTKTFQEIAKISEAIKNPSHNKFSQSVVFALIAKIKLHKKLGRLPTKNAVIKESEIMARESNRTCFASDESPRWTEVFRIAGLQYLPKFLSKRGKNMHL